MEPTQIPTADILKLIVGTGLVTALANQGIGWLRDLRKEKATSKRDATYLAMRIAIVLERFAITCAEEIATLGYVDREEAEGMLVLKLPKLSPYPSDADWKALEPALSARALSVDNEVQLSAGTIDAIWEVDPGQAEDVSGEQLGKCGFRAWQLAGDLRRYYGLPPFQPENFSWDIANKLKTYHDKALGPRARNAS